MTPLRSSLAPIVLAAAAPALAGPPPAPPVQEGGATARVLVDAAGEIPWVRGEDYKAGFGPAGPVFVPFLGSAAPRNEPLALRLREVRVGSTGVPLELDAPARLEGESRVVYERGALAELYRLTPRGIEQMFRIDQPLVAGPITLVVGFETELAPVADAAGIGFVGARGGVRYGTAVAVDARGRSAEVPVTLGADALELRVGADFLAHAAYPVLVDPLITTFAVDATPADDRDPDVAYDASLGVLVVVWERVFSQTDVDLHGRVLDAGGGALSEFAVDASPSSYHEVRVAGIDALDRFLVSGLRGQSSPVDCRLVDVSAGGAVTVGPLFQVLEKCETHDTAGDPGATPPFQFCIAAQTNYFQIRFVDLQLLGGDGLPGPSWYFGDSDDEAWAPRLSPAAGGPADAPRAWSLIMERGLSLQPSAMQHVRIRPDGTWGSFLSLGGTAGRETVGVSSALDAATGEPVVVALARETPGGGAGAALRARVVRGDAAGPPIEVGPFPGWSYEQAALDGDGSSFVVVYTQRAPGATARTVHAATYNVEGLELVLVERQQLSDVGGERGAPGAVSQRSGGGAPQRFLAAWHDLSPPGGDIEAAVYDSPGPGRVYCDAAPNSVGPGARISASGSISLALGTFTLHVAGCPPTRPGMFYLGETEIQLPFGDGFRCIGGATARVLPVVTTDGAGAASVTLDFDQPYGALVEPGAPGIAYQFWYRDPAGGPATFNLSDALHVEHTP